MANLSAFCKSARGDGGGGGGGSSEGFDHPPAADVQISEERFPVPVHLAGAVIGKGGETVQNIQKRTGARVQMSKEPDQNGNRSVQLSGTPNQIKSAKEMIIKLVHDEKMRAPKSLPGEEVLIPDASVGLILGKGGETIKQITQRTGCNITLDDAPRGTPQRVMRLKGKPLQIAAARNEILDLVRSGQEGNVGGPRSGPMGGPGGPDMQQPMQPSAPPSGSSKSSGWEGTDNDGTITEERTSNNVLRARTHTVDTHTLLACHNSLTRRDLLSLVTLKAFRRSRVLNLTVCALDAVL